MCHLIIGGTTEGPGGARGAGAILFQPGHNWKSQGEWQSDSGWPCKSPVPSFDSSASGAHGDQLEPGWHVLAGAAGLETELGPLGRLHEH